jgi:hypothetical protein
MSVGIAAAAVVAGGVVTAIAAGDSYGWNIFHSAEGAASAVGLSAGRTQEAGEPEGRPVVGDSFENDGEGDGDGDAADAQPTVPPTADRDRSDQKLADRGTVVASPRAVAGTAKSGPTSQTPTSPTPTSSSSTLQPPASTAAPRPVALAAPATAYPPTTTIAPAPSSDSVSADDGAASTEAAPASQRTANGAEGSIDIGGGPSLQAAPPADSIDEGSTTQVDDEPAAVLAALGIDLGAVLPGWTIEFLGPRTGMRGTTFPYEHRIEIYFRDSFTEAELFHVVGHEVGHAIDVTYLNDEERSEWARARGYEGQAWWTGNGLTDFAVGAGDWAECFAWARMGYGPWYSELGDPPGPENLALLASLAD